MKREDHALHTPEPRGPGPSQPAPPERSTLILASAATALAMAMLAVPMITPLQLPVTLHANVIEQAWMLGGAGIGLTVGLTISCALTDRLGLRALFVVGAEVEAAFLYATIVFPNPIPFTVARVGQGLGAAALLAASLGLITRVAAPSERRTRAISIWATTLGSGILIGPVLAATLDPLTDWRFPYLTLSLLNLIAIIFSRAVLVGPQR